MTVEPLLPGARVLVTGAGLTGRSVSAVLEPTGVRLTICDDDPLALQRLITPAKVVTTAEAEATIGEYALVVTSPGFAPTTPVRRAPSLVVRPAAGDVVVDTSNCTKGAGRCPGPRHRPARRGSTVRRLAPRAERGVLDCPPMSGRGRSLGWRHAAWLAALLILVGVAERGSRVLLSRRLGTAGAQWIWASGALERSAPVTFYAVRDFELDSPPSQARRRRAARSGRGGADAQAPATRASR